MSSGAEAPASTAVLLPLRVDAGAVAHPPGLPALLRTPGGLALLELQGSVNVSVSGSGSVALGRLEFPHGRERDGRVHLFVGQHQRLVGEVCKLPRALAVVRRRTAGDAPGDELEIVDIVQYKLVFAHRPEPVGST